MTIKFFTKPYSLFFYSETVLTFWMSVVLNSFESRKFSSRFLKIENPHRRDGQNNGNTGQYRNKTVCVGCTEHQLCLHYSFVYLCCVVPLSVLYRLYLVTFHMKVLQNGKMFPISGWVCVLRTSKRPIILNAWFQLWNMEINLWWFGQQYLVILLVYLLWMVELLPVTTWTF